MGWLKSCSLMDIILPTVATGLLESLGPKDSINYYLSLIGYDYNISLALGFYVEHLWVIQMPAGRSHQKTV